MYSIAHVVPSIAVTAIGTDGSWWSLPTRTAVYVVAAVGLNYIMTGLGMSFVRRSSVLTTIFYNDGLKTLSSTLALSFSGGIFSLLFRTPTGYLMAPGLFW